MLKLTDQEFRDLTTFVHKNYGIDLSKKRILIEGRMSNMLADHGITTFRQYMDILFADKTGHEITQLLNKLTTNYTYFRRETEHFDFLLSTVLPYFEQTRTNRVLYLWSAGCSSGQEPYTLAMHLHDYFGSRKSSWDTTILASDISENAMSKAKQAIYTAEEIKDVLPGWRSKYFVDLHNGTYQVNETIRKEVVFRKINLMEPFQFKHPFDLILCRNVMIYFDSPTKDRLVNKFYDWTSDTGYLFIGHSESINRDTTRYAYIQPAIYQRRGGSKV